MTCAALGIEEVSTYREQVRIRPVALADALRLDLADRVPGSTYHEAKRTLNLAPERIAGADLPGWVEARLREAVGDAVAHRGPRRSRVARIDSRFRCAPSELLACCSSRPWRSPWPPAARASRRWRAWATGRSPRRTSDQAAALQHVLADLQGAPCGGEPAEGESADTACDRVALSGELLWLAVAPYAEEHDITAASGEAEQAVAQLETQFGADQLERSLGARDLTRDDLIALGKKILTIQAVRVAVAEERIGEDALRSQYEDRVPEFTTVEANHILLETRADAQRIYEQVKDATRERFAAVAKQESTEPGADESGGISATRRRASSSRSSRPSWPGWSRARSPRP